jgi:hypothetical protein
MKFYALCSAIVLGLFIYGGQGEEPVIKEAFNFSENEIMVDQSDYNIKLAEDSLLSLVGKINNELYPFYDEKTNKVGYFDKFGNVSIEPQFDFGEKFNYGYANVGLDDKKCVIDINKEYVKDINDGNDDIKNVKNKINELVKEISENSDYKVSKLFGLYGVKDKNGDYIIKPKYKGIDLMESNDLNDRLPEIEVNYEVFVGNYAVFNNGNKDILVDKEGNEINDLKYEKLKLDDDFILGYNQIKDKSVSIIDLNDRKSNKEFLEVLYIDRDRAIAKNDKGYMIIDNKGNFISDIYEKAYLSPRSRHKFIFADDKNTYLIDREGKELNKFNKVYDEFEMYSSNLYFGQNKGQRGEYLDSKGNTIGYYKEK